MPNHIPSSSINWVTSYVKNMKLDPILPNLLTDTSKLLWTAAAWRWTLGSLAPATVLANTLDISLGTLPADFLFGYQAWITATGNSGTPRPLEIVAELPGVTSVVGQPTQLEIIGDAGAAGTARFFPTPGSVPTGSALTIMYKKQAPTLTIANQGTAGALVIPDEYVPVYNMGLLYYAYLYADDPRAGAATYQDGRISYSGQLAVFMSFIQEMRMREKLPVENTRYPDKKGEK